MRQVQSMQGRGAEIDSPISVAVDLEALRQSGNPEQRQLADVLAAVAELRSGLSLVEKKLGDPTTLLPPTYLRDTMLQDFRSMFENLAERIRVPRIHPGMIEELSMLLNRLRAALEPSEGRESTLANLEEARELLRRSDRIFHMFAMETGMPPGMYKEFMSRRVRTRKPE